MAGIARPSDGRLQFRSRRRAVLAANPCVRKEPLLCYQSSLASFATRLGCVLLCWSTTLLARQLELGLSGHEYDRTTCFAAAERAHHRPRPRRSVGLLLPAGRRRSPRAR